MFHCDLSLTHFFVMACSGKSQSDIAILVSRTMQDPSDARSWCSLGEAYTAVQQHKEASKSFQHCYELSDSDEEAAIAMYKAATNLATVGQYDDAIEALSQGMTRHPALSELPWFASFVSLQAGRHQAAADWARLATVHGCYNGTCPKRTGFEDSVARYEGPFDTLQWSLRALGDLDGALAAQRHQKKAIQKRQQAYISTTQDAAGQQTISGNQSELILTSVNGSKPRIGLGFTTAKRPETFTRTYLSFRCD